MTADVEGKLYIQLTTWGDASESVHVVGAETDELAPMAHIFWLKTERERLRAAGREAYICKQNDSKGKPEYALFGDMKAPGTGKVYLLEEVKTMAVEA